MLRMITIRELTTSWQEIEARDGKPGSDGVTISDFARTHKSQLKLLAKEIANGSYKSSPARMVRIPKGGGQFRSISILCVRDRIVHHALCQAIRPMAEASVSEVCHAYRMGRGVNSAVARVRDAANSGYEWAVSGDISDYFDSIDVTLLMEVVDAHMPRDIARLLRACLVPLAVDGKGIPQGSAIAPILSNLYLVSFDAGTSSEGPIVRYADNFIWLARTKDEADGLMQKASAKLGELALRLNPKSTVMRTNGMVFLGETI